MLKDGENLEQNQKKHSDRLKQIENNQKLKYKQREKDFKN